MSTKAVNNGSVPAGIKSIQFQKMYLSQQFRYCNDKPYTTRHIELKNKQNEIKKFRNVTLKSFPNTNRVLVGESRNNKKANSKLNTNTNTNSKRTNYESSQFAYISNVEYKVMKRTQSAYGKESFDFNKSNNINFKDNQRKIKKEIKSAQFDKYSTTTQIQGLPGGMKRVSNDINDDYLKIKKRNCSLEQSKSFKYKLTKDYITNISCWPGCKFNEKGIKKIKLSRKVFKGDQQNYNERESDIFNLKKSMSQKDLDTEIHSKKMHKKIFPEKNNTISPVHYIKKRNLKNESHFDFV